jgi:predicted Rossmann fold nucleotide-binding protein DprA/Smf involved in DNA uptake
MALAGDPDVTHPTLPLPDEALRGNPQEPKRAPTVLAALVRSSLTADPVTFDELVTRCGLPIGQVALGLEQLEEAGMAQNEGGWWSLPRR